MRITKTMAEDLANSFLNKRASQVAQLSIEMKEYVTEEYLNCLPEEVIKFYNSDYSYFLILTRSIRGYIEGIGWHDIYFKYEVPESTKGRLDFCKNITEKYTILYNKLQTLLEENSELRDNLIQAFLSLKTVKNVIAEFPDAAQHLPNPDAPKTTSVAIRYDDLKARLQ